jgi:hypothetical protein
MGIAWFMTLFLVIGIAALFLAIGAFTGATWLMNLRRQIDETVWMNGEVGNDPGGQEGPLGE